MTSNARTIVYKPRADRTGLPLVLVECSACPARFPSAAKKRARCPDCRRYQPVHRSARQRQQSPAAATVPSQQKQIPPPLVQQVPVPVQQPRVFSPIPPPPPSAAVEVNDDDMVYCFGLAGQLVPATWTGAGWAPATPAAIAAFYLGWQLASDDPETCQVIEDRQRCDAGSRHLLQGSRSRDDSWICSAHCYALGKLLNHG